MQAEAQDEHYNDFLTLCQGIGYIIAHCSMIEQNVDNWVAVAIHDCGGKSLRSNADLPRSMGQKIKFLNACFKHLEKLAPYKDAGKNLLPRIRELFDLRNDLVHGTLKNITPTNGEFRFQIYGYESQIHTVREFSFALSAYPILEIEASGLLTDSIQLSSDMVNGLLGSKQ